MKKGLDFAHSESHVFKLATPATFGSKFFPLRFSHPSRFASKLIKNFSKVICLLSLFNAWHHCFAYDELVIKKAFELPQYITFAGPVIKNVRIGYETYGRLNERADNAVLICHFMTGTSHAAGKYHPLDAYPGYWDSLIGPGLTIDTKKYFVISSDTLVNLSVPDQHVITTGPASINLANQKYYGFSFPILTIQDFVRIQKALADQLGIKRFKLVMGASMGAMQTLEWAVDYPEMVDRIIPVTSSGFEASAYFIQTLHNWSYPVMMDPQWSRGDYYGRRPPTRGLAQALEEVTLSSRSPAWAQNIFANKIAIEGQQPLQQWAYKYAIEETFTQAALARSNISDANHFLYLVRAQQLFKAGNFADTQQAIERVQAKSLFISASSDQLFFPEYAQTAVKELVRAGKQARYLEIKGIGGNLDGITELESMGEQIKDFLEH
jgi:homoserine O-acetyltransferase